MAFNIEDQNLSYEDIQALLNPVAQTEESMDYVAPPSPTVVEQIPESTKVAGPVSRPLTEAEVDANRISRRNLNGPYTPGTTSGGSDPTFNRGGNRVITLVGNPQENKVIQSPGVQQAVIQTKLSTDLFNGIQQQMDAIAAQQDPIAKLSSLTTLKASVAEASSSLMTQIRQSAEQQMGIPQLEADLKAAMALDRKSPHWASNLTDSNQTMAVRAELDRARERSGNLAKRLVAENPTIAGMAARVDSFIKIQEHLSSKGLETSDKKAALVDSVVAQLGPDTPKYLSYLYPEVNGDPKKAAQVYLQFKNDPNKKDHAFLFDPALTDEKVLEESFKGNRAAQAISIRMHSEKTGAPKEVVTRELSEAAKFVNNEAFFVDQMKTMAKGNPAYTKALQDYTLLKATPGTASAKQAEIVRQDLVGNWLTATKTTQALNNVESWTGIKQDPELTKVIDTWKTLNPGKSMSMTNLMDSFVNKAPKEQQAARLESIKKVLTSYVDNNNKGIYGKIDAIPLINTLVAKNSVSSVLGTILDNMSVVSRLTPEEQDAIQEMQSKRGIMFPWQDQPKETAYDTFIRPKLK